MPAWVIRWLPGALLLANASVSAWVVYVMHPMESAIFSDMGEYFQRSEQVRHGHFDPAHFFQPIGYTLWMAAWREAASGHWWLLKLTHVVLATTNVFLGWRTARRLLPGRWDLAVLALLATDIQWWAMASFAMSETLYTFFVTLLAWSAVRWAQAPTPWAAAATGLAFALGFLVKGTAAPFPLIFGAWALLRAAGERVALRRTVVHLTIMASALAIVTLGHGAFALARYGKFKLGAEAGGLNFVEGKCPSKRNIDSRGAWSISPLFTYLGETQVKQWEAPFTDQAYYWQQGLRCVRDHPLVLLTSGRYVYYLFAGNPLWPVEEGATHRSERLYEALFAVLVVPLFVVGMVVALIRWRNPIAVPALLYASLFVTAWVFKSELRFRVPFDAITMIYAVLGAHAVRTSLLRFKGWEC